MPRFAANLSMMYTEHAFLDRFAAAAADGFRAVEFLFGFTLAAGLVVLFAAVTATRPVLSRTRTQMSVAQRLRSAWPSSSRRPWTSFGRRLKVDRTSLGRLTQECGGTVAMGARGAQLG